MKVVAGGGERPRTCIIDNDWQRFWKTSTAILVSMMQNAQRVDILFNVFDE